MEQVMLFAVPKSRMTMSMADSIAGSLGKPSKMPGMAYGISAKLCKIGAKLAKVKGSTCSKCYALKGNYVSSSVRKAHEKRARGLSSVSWKDAMVKKIGRSGTDYFRWHDSGDLQSLQHLLDIVAIAEALPSVKFWIPTREIGMIKEYVDVFGAFPGNLCVRVSAAMIDGKPPSGFENTSTVSSTLRGDSPLVIGGTCPAPHQGSKCLDCRACWDKTVANVNYKVH